MADNRCKPHGAVICSECVFVTDAGKRAYDIVRSYVHFVDYETRIRSWVAIRLEDGGSDGNLYDSKREAIRHQLHEQQCMYFSYRGSPEGFQSPKDAQLYLDYHRHIYSSGGRFADPDDASGGRDLIMPTTREQLMMQLEQLVPEAHRYN